MLRLELAGQKYSKADHRRALLKLISGRSEGAVELKHQNISAVLIELGSVYIAGYKPAGNYQSLLWEVVSQRLGSDADFDKAAMQAVEREAVPPDAVKLDSALVSAPVPRGVRESRGQTPAYLRPAVRRDYLEREARNRSLGLAGEEFVAAFEARRLHALGKGDLASKVEQVSITQGDGKGYDVLSFEASGRERFIEVKTTSFGAATPFYVSRNEVAFSEAADAQFVLARVHEFRSEPKFFELKGALRKNVRLDPVSFLANIS
jgi:hypothetical protein